MRPLETVLLVVCLLWLAAAWWPWLRRWSRPLAVMMVLVALLQLLLEGWRWQAAPLYLVSVLAAWWFLRARPPGRVVSMAGGVLALSAGFLMWALPVFETPPLTGPHPVGVAHFHWQDDGRLESRREPPGAREVVLSVWYPAAPGAATSRAPWIPEFAALKADYAAKLGWPTWMADYLRHSRGQARTEAVPADGTYPLVLYSHGLNRNRFEAVSRMEALASHGYFVVAVDHPYGADFVRFPDGRIERFTSQRSREDTLADIDRKRLQRLDVWVADLQFVLDAIARQPGPLWEHVDLDHVAAAGYSNGGSAALLLAGQDPRVDAAVDLDGTPRGAVVDAMVDRPLLFMESEPPPASDEELARWQLTRDQFLAPSQQMWDRMAQIRRQATAPTWRYRLRGAQHSNFTDAPMISPLSAVLGIGGAIDSHRAAAVVDRCLLGFLRSAFGEGPTGAVDAACDSPELVPVRASTP